MRDRPRVLVCEALHDDALRLLGDVATVDLRPGISQEEIQATIGSYQALIVGPDTLITQDIIEEALNLRVIGCTGPRLDNVDVTAARSMGVEVRYSPSSSAVAIAEHTIALMLRLGMQGLGGAGLGGGLAGKTLGIVCFGRTGREVEPRALSYDMREIATQSRMYLVPEL